MTGEPLEAGGAVETPDLDHDPRALDPDAIPAGTSVLVAGPAMTGKRRLAFEIAGASRSQNACLVTTKAQAERIRAWFELVVNNLDGWTLPVIDCVSRSMSFDRQPDSESVRYVSSPADLTGVGIELTGVFSDWHHANTNDPRLAMHSLSTFLMYADLKQVYRFLYVVTGRLRMVNGVGAYTLDTNTGSSEVLGTFKQLFDALVEVRDGPESAEFRVRGGEFGPRQWTEF